MYTKHRNEIHRMNYLTSETEALYHQASLKLGVSDSVSMVLYAIYDTQGDCLLSDICKDSGISKQTINSAVRSLEADGMLRLEKNTGRTKKIVLTRAGEELIERTAARLYEAESKAFDEWTDSEVNTYIRLMEKYADCFRRQVEKL